MADQPGTRFDRVPANPVDRAHEDQPTRREVLSFFFDRYGIDRSVFGEYTFWERGKGKIWAFRGTAPTPIAVEGLGLTLLRTGGRHWKPTTNAIQTFGFHATRNVIELREAAARAYWAGEDQEIEWDGDWGYLVVSCRLHEKPTALGVGLYINGELRSVVPKSRQRDVLVLDRDD